MRQRGLAVSSGRTGNREKKRSSQKKECQVVFVLKVFVRHFVRAISASSSTNRGMFSFELSHAMRPCLNLYARCRQVFRIRHQLLLWHPMLTQSWGFSIYRLGRVSGDFEAITSLNSFWTFVYHPQPAKIGQVESSPPLPSVKGGKLAHLWVGKTCFPRITPFLAESNTKNTNAKKRCHDIRVHIGIVFG